MNCAECPKLAAALTDAAVNVARALNEVEWERTSERGESYWRLDEESYGIVVEAQKAWSEASRALLAHMAKDARLDNERNAAAAAFVGKTVELVKPVSLTEGYTKTSLAKGTRGVISSSGVGRDGNLWVHAKLQRKYRGQSTGEIVERTLSTDQFMVLT